MDMTNTKQNLWRALELLMQKRYGSVNINRLSRESGVGLGTVARLKSTDSSIALDKLDKLAETFGVAPWDLLRPDFDPEDTCAAKMSPMAADLARMLDSIPDTALQDRAYALASGVLQFGTATTAPAAQPSASGALSERQRHENAARPIAGHQQRS